MNSVIRTSSSNRPSSGRRHIYRAALILGLLLLPGCRSAPPETESIIAPDQARTERRIAMMRRLPTVKSVTPWTLPEFIRERQFPGLKITTSHYEIYTSLQDPLILRQIPVFLESAFRSYAQVLGRSIETDKKLQVYFFDTREQWEDFSRYWTGGSAPIYLKIKAGAYYFKGASIAYRLSRKANFSILAHEGWHQFSDELFKLRLPAWLDEGLATNFEAFRWENGQVIFDPRNNGSRLWALKNTLNNDRMIPLSDLLTLDAGRVLSHTSADSSESQSNPRVAAYYAQLYALIRFFREDNYGKRLGQFQDMLDDAYYGRWPLDDKDRDEATQRQHNPSRLWNAKIGRLIFETHIAPSTTEIEPGYHIFCRKILAQIRFKKQL